jgi:hypothetical protein
MTRNNKPITSVVSLSTENHDLLAPERRKVLLHKVCHSPARILHEHETGDTIGANRGFIAPSHFACSSNGLHL